MLKALSLLCCKHDSLYNNILIGQVVMGREFCGEAFKPSPALVLFKDFEVGQSYRQVITLTNISLARNTFKASHCLGSRRLHVAKSPACRIGRLCGKTALTDETYPVAADVDKTGVSPIMFYFPVIKKHKCLQ